MMPAPTEPTERLDGIPSITEGLDMRGPPDFLSLAMGTPSDFQRVRIIPDPHFWARTGVRFGIYGEDRIALGLPKGGREGIWWTVTWKPDC